MNTNSPIENQIDNMSDQFSAQRTQFIDWLSSWLGVSISNNVDELAKRKLLSDMVRLYGIRGTKQYFVDIIKCLVDIDVRIEHEREYRELLEALEAEGFFESDEEEEWVCEVCGHVHRGKKAPGACPLCRVDKEYFKKRNSDVTVG